MEYRRATDADFAQILALQQLNLRENLTQAQLSLGFLSRAYTLEEFRRMSDSIAVIVAAEHRVHGYLCAATPSFSLRFPYPAALFKSTASINYQGRPLNDYRCCLVNPMCIEKSYRGTHVFAELCQTMISLISANYEIALSLIAKDNQHSLQSVRHMMQVCGEFAVDNNEFWILQRDLRQ